MTGKQKSGFIACAAALTVSGLAVSIATNGSTGAEGFLLGFIGGLTHLVGLWLLIALLGSKISEASNIPKPMPPLAMLMPLLIPVILPCILISHSLGAASDRCFMGGLGLVYFVVVGWAVFCTQLD